MAAATQPAPGHLPPALEVKGVDFSYGQLQVLFGVDLHVRSGEVLALLGNNGAGKTTLLRVISGLETPFAGRVFLDGTDITRVAAEDRVRSGIVQIPSGRAVFPSLTVRENLALGAYTFLRDRASVTRRREELLELFPRLRERIEQKAGTLSGGERQMLALAKGLLLEPKVLCIDELTLGLAPALVSDLLRVVEGLRDRNTTMLIVEPSVNIALGLADRAVFMEKGRIQFEGPAEELLERDDLLQAVFLGGTRR